MTNWGKHPKSNSEWVKRIKNNRPCQQADEALTVYQEMLNPSSYTRELRDTLTLVEQDIIYRVQEHAFIERLKDLTPDEKADLICTEWSDDVLVLIEKHGLCIDDLPQYEMPIRVPLLRTAGDATCVAILELDDTPFLVEQELENAFLVRELVRLGTHIHVMLQTDVVSMAECCKVAYNYQLLISVLEYKFSDSKNELPYYQDFSNSAKKQLKQLENMLKSRVVVLVPTFDVLSYNTLIKLGDVPLYPIGMSNSPVKAHGALLFPVLYFLHDVGHAWHFFKHKKHQAFVPDVYKVTIESKYKVLDAIRGCMRVDKAMGFRMQMLVFFISHELDKSMAVSLDALVVHMTKQTRDTGWAGDYELVRKIVAAWSKDMQHLTKREQTLHYGRVYNNSNELRDEFSSAIVELIRILCGNAVATMYPELRLPLSGVCRRQDHPVFVCEAIESLEVFTFVAPSEIGISFGWEEDIKVHKFLESPRLSEISPGLARQIANALRPAIISLTQQGFSFFKIIKGICSGDEGQALRVWDVLITSRYTPFRWLFYMGIDLFENNLFSLQQQHRLAADWKVRTNVYNNLCDRVFI